MQTLFGRASLRGNGWVLALVAGCGSSASGVLPGGGDGGATLDGMSHRSDAKQLSGDSGGHDASLLGDGNGGDAAPDVSPAGDGSSATCGIAGDAAALGPSCCTTGNAHCVPSSDVPAGLVSDFSTCTRGSGSGVCVPDEIIAEGTTYTPASCTALGSAGVCLSQCLGVVASNPDVGLLSQGSCDTGELCVPCTNPLTNAPTGACTIKGEPCGSHVDAAAPTDAASADAASGPTCPYTGPALINPDTFPACTPACAGAHCIPAAIVPAAEQSLLAACGTGASAGFCAPDTFIASEDKAVPATCTSIAGAEGRCLSTCLPSIAAEADLLPVSTCAAGEVCAPCYNPTAVDPSAPTGACSIACDAPTQPPVVLACPYTGPAVIDPTQFPACSPACGGAHCVPTALVPNAEQAELSACGTGAGAGFCTPDAIVSSDNHYVPPTCTPFSDPNSEGRCTSTCLPGVEADASELVEGPCASDQLCAPCWDPFSGDSTGACNLACDMPAKPTFTFPTCCDDPVVGSGGAGQGTCLPKTLVPSSEASDLNTDVCPSNSADYLCVPNEYLPNSATPIQTCMTDVGAGACVSNCVNVTGSFLFSQDSCPDNHICVPCDVAEIFGTTPPGCD